MASHAPVTPDAKRKKPALPSILSNIRNASTTLGRAADDHLHERETRPLTGGGGRMASGQPQLHRGPSSALSTLQNFSQRFGSQWRKRSRRRKGGQGVTIVPQSFYVAVGCFFVAFPVIFVLYILARHSVFGDEADPNVHKHEVPSSFANGMDFESGAELLEMNKIDQPDVASTEGAANVAEKSPLIEEVANDSQDVVLKEEDSSSREASNVQEGEDLLDKVADASDSAKQSEGVKDEIAETSADGSAKEAVSAPKAVTSSSEKGDDEEITEQAAKASSDDLPSASVGKETVKAEAVATSSDAKAVDMDISEKAAKASSDDLLSASVRKEAVAAVSSSDQAKEKVHSSKEGKADAGNLRGSRDEKQ